MLLPHHKPSPFSTARACCARVSKPHSGPLARIMAHPPGATNTHNKGETLRTRLPGACRTNPSQLGTNRAAAAAPLRAERRQTCMPAPLTGSRPTRAVHACTYWILQIKKATCGANVVFMQPSADCEIRSIPSPLLIPAETRPHTILSLTYSSQNHNRPSTMPRTTTLCHILILPWIRVNTHTPSA